MSAATPHRIIDVTPQAETGPCEACGNGACFCPLCAKAKAGKRLCGKCIRAEAAKATGA